MNQSEDYLSIFENRVRNTGLWCVPVGLPKFAHYMVCKHPKATMAISLCGQIIVPFIRLHEDTITQHCLVCELYSHAEKETKDRNKRSLITLLDATIQPDQTEQEKT